MSVISTYLNDSAPTPLNQFVVYMLYKQVCSRHGDKTNRWSLGLSVGGLKRHRCDNQSPSCTHLLIAARGVARRIVSKSTVAQTKMGHVSKTTPLSGVFCHPFGKTRYGLPSLKMLRALASAIPEIWMGHPKFKTCHVT